MSGEQQTRHKVVICLLVTRKYHVFCQPLIDSICKYFLLRHTIEINLFTDDPRIEYKGDERVSIVKHLILSYGFPEITLFRYRIMTSIEYECDYLYYLDIDYLIAMEIDENILGDIVAVLHPGFSMMGGGSWCDDHKSLAYTMPHDRIFYAAGGTQGGRYEYYYPLMLRLKENIEEDERRGIRAIHNDESHLNSLLPMIKNLKLLDSSYCMVEQIHLRIAWRIDKLKPKILALEKNHLEIRS